MYLLKKILKEQQYDIIHCHTPVGALIARIATIDVRKQGISKVIYTAHGFHFYKGASKKLVVILSCRKILFKIYRCSY